MELELHITCTGCGKIRVTPTNFVTPFEHHRLRCSYCGARDPKVTEERRVVPFTPEYKPRVFWFPRE